MNVRRCSFCFSQAGEDVRGVAGARAYICADCIARSVAALLADADARGGAHPATEEFLLRFQAFREQLET